MVLKRVHKAAHHHAKVSSTKKGKVTAGAHAKHKAAHHKQHAVAHHHKAKSHAAHVTGL